MVIGGQTPDPVVFGSGGKELFIPGVPHCLGKANVKACLRAPRLGTDGGFLPLGPLELAPQEGVW